MVFKGPKPLYGTVKFDQEYLKRKSGTEYHFVIDATGDAGYEQALFRCKPRSGINERSAGRA